MANAWPVDAALAKVRPHMETAKRSTHTKGSVVMPRRWVVEACSSGSGETAAFAKDFENLAGALVPFVALAFIRLALRRLALAQVVNSTNRRPATHDHDGRQIGL